MNGFKCMQVLLFHLFVLFKIQTAVTHYMEVFSLFTCVLWTNKQKLKNKTCIYYHNYYDIVFINLFPKKTQYVYIYIVNHIDLSLMINKSTTNRMQCYSLIRI